jgi:hypothetical protein
MALPIALLVLTSTSSAIITIIDTTITNTTMVTFNTNSISKITTTISITHSIIMVITLIRLDLKMPRLRQGTSVSITSETTKREITVLRTIMRMSSSKTSNSIVRLDSTLKVNPLRRIRSGETKDTMRTEVTTTTTSRLITTGKTTKDPMIVMTTRWIITTVIIKLVNKKMIVIRKSGSNRTKPRMLPSSLMERIRTTTLKATSRSLRRKKTKIRKRNLREDGLTGSEHSLVTF